MYVGENDTVNIETFVRDLFSRNFADVKFPENETLAKCATTLPFTDVYIWEYSGSVVECLSRDQGDAGSSLTGVTALCP